MRSIEAGTQRGDHATSYSGRVETLPGKLQHPVETRSVDSTCLPHNLRQWAPVRSRADSTVTYYLVDLGISSWFLPDDINRLVLGTSGLDEEVPELSDDVPYDPFKVDIFVLGNFFRHLFTGKFTNLDFLDPLVRQMTDKDPARRPSAVDALRQWKKLGSSTWSLQHLWRPRPRDSNFVVHAVADTFSLLYIIYRCLFLVLL